MIRTTDELASELDKLKQRYGNNTITIRYKNREYIIENTSHVIECGDGYSSHMCLDIRPIEGCNIIR